jgi:membrane fusion protein, multidrug efflux system
MNTVKTLFVALAAGMMVVGVSCTSKTPKDAEVKTQDTVRVKTMFAKQDIITRNIDYTASLVAFEEVHLAPASPGRIKQFNVEIGSSVNKGEVIAVMDSTNLEQSRITLLKLAADFKRMDTLKKTNSITAVQYDLAKSSYEIARSGYQNLLNNTQLRAPFSGVISGKYFEDGEIYSGTPVASIGKAAIVSIVQINQLKALVGIASSYYPLITTGLKTVITSDIYPDLELSGVISKIYPTLDNSTKTFIVEVKIANENLKLRPGMFAKIQINLGKGKAMMVPTIALVKQTGTNDMYLYINKNGIAHKVKVTTGILVDDKTEILTGLNEDDEVIIVGQNKLVDQSHIIIGK